MLNKINFTKSLTLLLVAVPFFLGPNNSTTLASSFTAVSNTVTGLSSASSKTTTTGIYIPTSGSAYTSFTVDLGSGYQSANICANATIFGLPGTATCSIDTSQSSNICTGTTLIGVSGTASCAGSGSTTLVTVNAQLESNAHRDMATTQITQSQEVTTYAGAALPTGYRDVSDITKDDEGYTGGSITYQTHPVAACGGSGYSTIADKITNCNTSWTGATKGNAGQGTWYLVTSDGASKEVWQDASTGLLWSTLMAANAANWCVAAGNNQNTTNGWPLNDPIGTCNANTLSYCAETSPYGGTLSPASASDGTGAGGSWNTTYAAQKGGVGAQTTPSVRWRLPTIYDYEQANIDGIRFVMPDMGAVAGVARMEWSATVQSSSRTAAMYFLSGQGYVFGAARTSGSPSVRCVGRGQ